MLLLQRILFALMWLNGSVFSWTTIPSRANVSQTQPNGWPGLTRAPRARRETPDAQCFICLNDRYTPACASSALYSATPSTLPANVTVAKCKHGCLVVAELGTRYPGSAPREISSVRRTCGDNWGWIDYTGIFNLTLPRSGFMCMHAAFGRHSIVCRCSLTDYCNGRITERDIYTLAYEMPNPGWEIYFNYNPPAPLPLADSVIPANNPVGTLWCISCGNCVLSNATQLPLGIKRIPCRHGCSIRGKYYGVSDMIGKFMSISRGCGEDQPNFDLLKGMDLRYPLASTFLCTRWINTIAKVPTYLVCRCVEHNCNWQLDVPELKTMGTEYPPNSSVRGFLWHASCKRFCGHP
ncbi:uncharacterized protein LOC129589449 isoform X3 [Paramacrobiotus metropolitanus]|uniref:uncharacterized protein LOC129589449 isoform X3 n=1 Tax=Paramacrobiotus metropolitanus TaxID=2943436 RepID=UPI002445EACE|nr:uncharacterized protein LOC129589449 isoform X3 [Paramacrobiotus metropolitanus]